MFVPVTPVERKPRKLLLPIGATAETKRELALPTGTSAGFSDSSVHHEVLAFWAGRDRSDVAGLRRRENLAASHPIVHRRVVKISEAGSRREQN